MVKLQQSGGRYFLCIPADLVRQKKWEKGMRLFLAYDAQGDIVIKDTITPRK